MAWVLLIAAGAVEIVMAMALKSADGWTRPGPSVLGLAVSQAFLDAYRVAHPQDEIERLDLWQVALPPFDAQTIEANFAVLRRNEFTSEQFERWQAVRRVSRHFNSADKYVFSVPSYLGDSDARLIRVRPPIDEMTTALWVLTHPDLARTARVRLLMDHVSAALGKQRPLLEGHRPRM